MPNYKVDPNDSTKQVPGSLPDNAYDRAINPVSCSFSKSPHSVIIGNLNANVGFLFKSSESFSAVSSLDTVRKTTVTGSDQYVMFGKPAAGTVLNIHPTAFSGSMGDENSITFVYKGGLDGQGRP